MIDVRITGKGAFVDDVPWTMAEVEQARRDSKACRESRRAGHCDCVACRIDLLFRRSK